jgi:O-antigen biosynthesis protein
MFGSMSTVLASFLRPTCLAEPRRLTPESAWKEHIPFAMNLVDVLAPRVIVELGTHRGDSYCAMCQAVASRALPTRCYAIDTWEGDAHAGTFGSEVLDDLRAHHDSAYGAFSRLVQSTFRAASEQFSAHSVDLLHVDGFHTYEAVKDDWDTWRPKLAPNAVVLFHDTNVRERDFGVWRLWGELRERYAHFEFLHGHGLGVLAVGDEPDALLPLFRASPEEAELVRQVFFRLGQRLTVEVEARTLREALRAGDARHAAEMAHVTDERDRAHARVTEERDRARARVLELEQQHLRAALAQAVLSQELDRVRGTRAWRAATTWWRLRDRVLGRAAPTSPPTPPGG